MLPHHWTWLAIALIALMALVALANLSDGSSTALFVE